jgi:hypothetical protein
MTTPTSPPSSAETTPTEAPTEGPTAADTSPTASASSASPAPTPTATAPKLTGLGATIEDWEDEHGHSVKGYSEGAVYGPIVRDDTHEYVGVVSGDDGRIYTYTHPFPTGTHLDLAEQLVLKDFPDDARVAVRDDDEASCLIVLIKSATLHKEIGSHAFAAFGTSDSPDLLHKSDVSDAIVGLASESGPDLGFC